ncbi:ALQxL family class IV lanthipeptide [Planomonospora sp. ID67723]|nr:ALQxL family class IV lanthipeptide [Planomonospora sp. ID67723]
MELDINALEMLPATEETQLRDCNSTCEVNIRTCFNSCNGSGYTY